MTPSKLINTVNRSLTSHKDYLLAVCSLLILFCLLSALDLNKDFSLVLFYHKITNDFVCALLIGLLFLPLYLLLKLANTRLANTLIKILFTLIALIQTALIGYSLSTHINLGSDLLGYSLSDIYTTVTASVALSPAVITAFIIVPLLFLGLLRLFQIIDTKLKLNFTLLICLLFAALQLLLANTSKTVYQNKLHYLISDILRSNKEERLLAEATYAFKKEYPLEKSAQETKDVLSPFFDLKPEKPNIVLIIIEGLGRDFTDDGAYSGFTPYLDSLTTKSLYWKNFLSNTGRTFGALPALLGSLPFGRDGFMELNQYPTHHSLISILKSNGYSCSYYCGDDITFDKKNRFLEYNGVDHIIEMNKYGPAYKMGRANAEGFSWGYPDEAIYRKTLSELNHKKKPRLDMIMTLSNHEPFEFPEKASYLKKAISLLDNRSFLERNKLKEYVPIFASLLYTDQALKKFMVQYAKRSDYANTIFIITGDHRLVPVPQKDNLSRFHVPLYIYSPMLKKTAVFQSVSSHNDVSPSLVSFLIHNNKLNKIEKTYWMGQGLDTARAFRNIHNSPLMRYKGSINDYLYKDYFYTDGQLFKIDSNFVLTEANTALLPEIVASFNKAKQLNSYLILKNKISPLTANHNELIRNFSSKELAYIKKVTKGLNSDQILILAKDFAFNKQGEKSRLLCDYILNDKPNYVDFRILKGRSLAWDRDYKNAEIQLLEAIKVMPFYDDSYNALLDVYFWSDQSNKAVTVGKQALSNKIKNPEISFKLARAYQKTGNKTLALKQLDSLLRIDPNNMNYQKFRKSLL